MSEWKTILATDYCDSVRDGTHDTPKPTLNGFKLVTGKHLKNGVIDTSDAYYISESDYNKINERSKVEQWDVLLSMIGTVGEVAVVKNQPDYAIKNIALFKCAGSELKGKWLAYYLKSPKAKGFFSGNQKGSSQQFLSLKQLRNLPIIVADESYMKYVVDTLSRYDSLIENYQKQIKLLEEAAQRLYKEWFVDLHFPGHENTKIVDGVPEGWEKKMIGEVCDTTSGGTPSRSKTEFYTGNIPWVKTKELNDDFIFDTEERITDDAIRMSSAKIIPSGSILMAMYGATIGKLGIATKELSCNQACCVFLLSEDNVLRFYLYSWLLDNRTLLISMGKGAAQPNLSQDMIKKLEIVIPSLHLLSIFDSKVKSIYKKIYYLSSQIHLLTEARDRLLPKLMSGEIAV